MNNAFPVKGPNQFITAIVLKKTNVHEDKQGEYQRQCCKYGFEARQMIQPCRRRPSFLNKIKEVPRKNYWESKRIEKQSCTEWTHDVDQLRRVMQSDHIPEINKPKSSGPNDDAASTRTTLVNRFNSF
uniref:hypothetical protein n=1 Tax=uncultured Altererythrobacter sp. TaxID=500840 RepID=UPI0026216A23|nr:hypothetical protein [uncultured Altererythrobacter sp.]